MKDQESKDLGMEMEKYNIHLEYFTKVNSKITFGTDMGILLVYFRVLSVNGKVVYSGDWERDKICGSGTIKNMHLIHRPNKLTDSGFLSFLREAWYSGEFE
jgi:hypothetical protein